MKKLFAFLDEYAQSLDCIDHTAIRLCVYGLGILIGLNISEERKRPVGILAGAVCVGTGVNLLLDLVVAAVRWCKAGRASADAEE